jgi:hypothetical protein
MANLSVRGVARKYAGATGGFSLCNDVLRLPIGGRPLSVRARLEAMARERHSFRQSECIYGWTAAFDQTWTHIVVRVRLGYDDNVSVTRRAALEARWKDGIERIWNGKWGCGRQREIASPLSFDVLWVTNDEHHTVQVSDCPTTGPCVTDMGHWHTSDPGSTAAHEFGHMLGSVDEYASGTCPKRSPVNTGTVMDSNSDYVPSRMMERFAANIGSTVVAI